MEQASSEDRTLSDAALWMLLLMRLTAVTTDDRLELRNSKYNSLEIPCIYVESLLAILMDQA